MSSITAIAGSAVIVSTLVVCAPASATTFDPGSAQVDLIACPPSVQGTTFEENCSYTHLTPKPLLKPPAFTFLTSKGSVRWQDGTVDADGTLSFPAVGQTWPDITGLFANATSASKANLIEGSVDHNGRVRLRIDFDVVLTAAGSQCVLSGSTDLVSDGVDPRGGAAGRAYDPETGQFAVVSAEPPVPSTSGTGCGTLSAAYDITKPMGWYLSGTLALPGRQVTAPPTPTPTAKKDQGANVRTPRAIRGKGKTVLLKKAVTTNAGQTAKPKVTWSTKRDAKGTNRKFAMVRTSKAGKVTITTTGKAKKLYVTLRLKAPATTQYLAYSYTRAWTIR